MREKIKSESSVQNSELEQVGSFNWHKIFKLFLLRVPLWAIAVFVLILGSWFGYSKITSENPVNLRPAITNAQNVEIVITTCNDEIDKQGFDIRTEERNLERDLKNTEGVKDAQVLIERDRENCEKQQQEEEK